MNTQTDTANPPNNGNGTRRRRLLIVAAIVVIALGSYGAYWFLHGRYFESTDDAYVSSDLVQISSEVAGAILPRGPPRDPDDSRPLVPTPLRAGQIGRAHV